MSAQSWPRVPVRLNVHRLEEVQPAMPHNDTDAHPLPVGWRSIGSHTVTIARLGRRYNYKLYIADERGRYTRTHTSRFNYKSEEAAISAARTKLNTLTNTE